MTYQLDVVGNKQGGIGSAVDSTTGTLKTTEQDQARYGDLVSPTFIDETDLPVADHYFPSEDGFSTYGFNNTISFNGELYSGSAGETLTLTIEESNGVIDHLSNEVWNETTDQYTDASGTQPPSAITITNGTIFFGVSRDSTPWAKVRVKIVMSGTLTSNAANVGLCLKAK